MLSIFHFIGIGKQFATRWNEHRLKEMRDEEDEQVFRQRSSRLQKWRELVDDAAKARSVQCYVPDALEILVFEGFGMVWDVWGVSSRPFNVMRSFDFFHFIEGIVLWCSNSSKSDVVWYGLVMFGEKY